MVFRFVEPVALDTFGLLDSTWECGMTPFLAIFTLQNPRVHVSTSNSCDEPTNVDALVNKSLGFTAALDIPYINLNDHHIWLRRCFDDAWFGYKSNIVKNLILLDDSFNIIQGKAILNIAMRKERNTYNLEIRLRLCVRCGSHQGGSPQNGLRDEWTCRMTLASAYVLCHLSAMWSQLQMKGRKSEWKWVLIGVSPLNTGDRV